MSKTEDMQLSDKVKELLDAPKIKEKYGITSKIITPHFKNIIIECLPDKNADELTVYDADDLLAYHDQQITNKIVILGISEDIVGKVTKRTQKDEIAFIQNRLLNTSDVALKQLYYEKLLLSAVRDSLGDEEEKRLRNEFSTNQDTLEKQLDELIKQRKQEMLDSFALDKNCYTFTIAEFDSDTRLTFEGIVTSEDFFDEKRLSEYVFSGKTLCDDNEIGKKINVELEHYLIGNQSLLDEEDLEPDCYLPEKLLDAIDLYPSIFLENNAELFDANTVSVDAGALELCALAKKVPLTYFKIICESGDVIYSPEKIDKVSDLKEWKNIRSKLQRKYTDIDEVEKIEIDEYCIGGIYADKENTAVNERIMQIIQCYENEPLIEEMTEQISHDEFFERLYLDKEDLFFDFLEHGREVHKNSGFLSEQAFEGYRLKYFEDTPDKRYDGKNINEIFIQKHGWQTAEQAVRIMSAENLSSEDISQMNIKCFDSNGRYCEKDLNAESAYMLFKATSKGNSENDVLDLTSDKKLRQKIIFCL